MLELHTIIAIAVSAIAMFALGALWYSPVLFGKIWQKETGLTEESLKKSSMIISFSLSFLLMLVIATGLNIMIQTTGSSSWEVGLDIALYTSLFLVCTSMGINYIYQQKTFKLWLIDASYQVIGISAMGAISGALA